MVEEDQAASCEEVGMAVAGRTGLACWPKLQSKPDSSEDEEERW